jgi:hypothetical protein
MAPSVAIFAILVVLVLCHAWRPHMTTMRAKSAHFAAKENEMSVDDLKSELETRGVDFEDCLTRAELADRLTIARASGKADEALLDDFKRVTSDGTDTIDFDSIDDLAMEDLTAGDGTLPGGFSPEMMKVLGSDPTIVKMVCTSPSYPPLSYLI